MLFTIIFPWLAFGVLREVNKIQEIIKMKRLVTILALVLALVLTLTACGSTESSSEAANSEEAVAESEQAEDVAAEEGENGKMDFADMTVGKITKIAGNSVTLTLGKIEMPEGMSKPEGDFDPENAPEGMSKPDGDFDPDNAPEDMSRPEGEEGEEGEGKGPGGKGGFMGNVTIEYTDETAEFVIPGEVKVGNSDYTSLNEGDEIGLQFDEDGIVEKVIVFNNQMQGGKGNSGKGE